MNQAKAKSNWPITSTWTMKKKSGRTYRAQLVAKWFQQIEGQHYDTSAISSPVTNDIAIPMLLLW